MHEELQFKSKIICPLRPNDAGIKSRRLEWAGHVVRMEEDRCAFRILTGTLSGRPRRRLEDNIRMDPKEIGINTRNWVDSAQDGDYWRALVNAALNLRVHES